MRRMRNRILLSGVAALLSAAVVAGPAAASTTHRYDPCDDTCGPVAQHGGDLLDLDLKLVLKIGLGLFC